MKKKATMSPWTSRLRAVLPRIVGPSRRLAKICANGQTDSTHTWHLAHPRMLVPSVHWRNSGMAMAM